MAHSRVYIDEGLILGYQNRVKCGAGQAALESLLGLDDPSTTKGLQDVVFVAMDFENFGNIRHRFSKSSAGPQARDSRVGISILDTRDFFRLSAQDMLSTQSFSTGALPYHIKALKRFRFGVSELISIYDITSKVEEALSRKDNRDVILVCHGGEPGGDTKTINSLLISDNAKPVRAVLGTTRIAHDLLGAGPEGNGGWRLDQLFSKLEMGHLLPEFGVDKKNEPPIYGFFHTAGNDANFTLRILLMMAVKGYERRNPKPAPEPPVVALLREIAKAPLPPRWSAAELDALLALQQEEPLDDPAVPVDPSRFRGNTPKVKWCKEMTEKTREHWAAAKARKVAKDSAPKAKSKQLEPLQAQDLNLP